jgi:heme exporter protein B
MRTLGHILRLLEKDFLVEFRTREVLVSMGLFSLLLVVVFAFAFQIEQDVVQALAPGIVWVTVAFAGNLGMSRVIDREREHGAMAGLLQSPAGAGAVFWAKTLSAFAFMLLVELLVVPISMVLIGIELAPGGLVPLIAGLFLGSFGFAVVGTLFAAMLAETRLREVIVPIIVYPVAVPVIVAGVKTAGIAFTGEGREVIDSYLLLLAGFDVIYGALAPWVFARVMVD